VKEVQSKLTVLHISTEKHCNMIIVCCNNWIHAFM